MFIFDFIAALSLFWFIPGFILFSIVLLIAISGGDENYFWATVGTIGLGILMYGKFRPSLLTLAIVFGSYVVIGIVYSMFKWIYECRMSYQDVMKQLDKIPENMPQFGLNSDKFTSYLLRRTWKSEWPREFTSKTHALQILCPQALEHKADFSKWAFLWIFYVLKMISFDLIETIQNWFSAFYQRLAYSQFKVPPPTK